MVYILLGRVSEMAISEEMPEIGLFRVYNQSAGQDFYALIYAEDFIGRKGENLYPLQYATGFIGVGGIGEISDVGSFKHGGGVVQSRQTSIALNNTGELKNALERWGISLFGRTAHIVEYSWDIVGSVDANPLFAGRVESIEWTESTLRVAAVPNIEMSRRSNISIDGLPVTFGTIENGYLKRLGQPEYLTHGFFTGNNSDNNSEYKVVAHGVFRRMENRPTYLNPDATVTASFQERYLYKLQLNGNKDIAFRDRLDAIIGGGLEAIKDLGWQLSNIDLFASTIDGNQRGVPIGRRKSEGGAGYIISIEIYPDADSAVAAWGNASRPWAGVGNADMHGFEHGSPFNTFAADEILLITERPIPEIDRFNQYPSDEAIRRLTEMLDDFRDYHLHGHDIIWWELYEIRGLLALFYTTRSVDDFKAWVISALRNINDALEWLGYTPNMQNHPAPTIKIYRANTFFQSDGWANNAALGQSYQHYNTYLTDEMKKLKYVKDGKLFDLSPHTLGPYGIEESRLILGQLTEIVPSQPYYARRPAIFLAETQAADTSSALSYVLSPIERMEVFSAPDLAQWEETRGEFGNYRGVNGIFLPVSRSAILDNVNVIVENPESGGIRYRTDAATLIGDYVGYFLALLLYAGIDWSIPGNNRYFLIDAITKLNGDQLKEGTTGAVAIVAHGWKTGNIDKKPFASDFLSAGRTTTITVGTNIGIINNYKGETVWHPPTTRTYVGREGGVYDAFIQDEVYYGFATENETDSRRLNNYITSYRQIPLSIGDNDSANIRILLLLGAFETNSINFDVALNKAAILYEDSVDISDGIIGYTEGRIFKGMADGQRPNHHNPWRPADRITSIVEVIEHIRRLSNWSEVGPEPSAGWGKGYPYNALIDTAAFDSPALDEVRGLSIGGQVIDESEALSDTIVRDICEDLYIISKNKHISIGSYTWMGAIVAPSESICSLDTPSIPDEDIPIITPRELRSPPSPIREPNANEIYCEPKINYQYVHGIGYTKTLSITNIATDSAWQPSFTIGLEDEDGKEIWDTCKALFNKYRSFADMPDVLTNQNWIQKYETALWKMRKVIAWQLKARSQIAVSWHMGRLWSVGTHIKLSLPHVRGGEPLLCVCEGVKKAKHSNKVTCDIIFLDDVNPPYGAFSIIDETGDANTVIDENAERPTVIEEGIA
jgi:hypothetical protein